MSARGSYSLPVNQHCAAGSGATCSTGPTPPSPSGKRPARSPNRPTHRISHLRPMAACSGAHPLPLRRRRKVAVFGKPGQGKSTLLAHFAWEAHRRGVYPDGIFWIALGHLPIAPAMMLSEWGRLAGVDAAGLTPREMAG